MQLVSTLALLLTLSCVESSKKCDLVNSLIECGLPMESINEWYCLVMSESAGNCSAVGGPNKNGSRDWGCFQINDNYWCKVGLPGNDCEIDCERLVDGDMADDCACALKIHARHGFSAWHGWGAKCKGRPLPDVSDCKVIDDSEPANTVY